MENKTVIIKKQSSIIENEMKINKISRRQIKLKEIPKKPEVKPKALLNLTIKHFIQEVLMNP